jgi:hypothetical protein
MTGEFGWEGGVILRTKSDYIIAAFSGGNSPDDVAVSRAGAAKVLEWMQLPKMPLRYQAITPSAVSIETMK